MFNLSRLCVCALVGVFMAWSSIAAAQTCVPRWTDEFAPKNFAGSVYAMLEFDDGSGLKLYAAGEFTYAPGGVSSRSVARWDGHQWVDVSVGINQGIVRTLCVHDAGDGNGPSLYVGGDFWVSQTGRPHSFGVGRWNGSRWVGLASGVGQIVRDLQSFNDGSGQKLFAAGEFSGIGTTQLIGAAVWNGESWLPLGSGLRNGVAAGYGRALAVFNSGSGDALYLGGNFITADGVTCNGLARWTGSTFEPVGSGVRYADRAGGFVRSLAVATIGGNALLIGGAFDEAGGVPASNVARWDGTTFSQVGDGLGPTTTSNNYVISFIEFQGSLYAGGVIPSAGAGVPVQNLARLTGSTWVPVAASPRGTVIALHKCSLCSSSQLLVGGLQTFAEWDGKSYDTNNAGLNGSVYGGVVADLGDGEALYVVGDFTLADDVPARRIAKWDGRQWSGMSDGFSCVVMRNPIEQYDDGTGNTLYVATCNGIARWTGSEWALLPPNPPTTPVIVDMAVFDRGDGVRLYVLGGNTTAGLFTYRLSSWDGHQWTLLGSGQTISGQFGRLAVVPHASAANAERGVYVNGAFQVFGGITSSGIVRYNGYSFSGVGPASGIEGSSGTVSDMIFVDSLPPHGPSVILAGAMSRVGGMPVTNGVAGWEGLGSWFGLSGGTPPLSGYPTALAAVNDGKADALFMYGNFSFAPNQANRYLLKYSAAGFEIVRTLTPVTSDSVSAILPMTVQGSQSLVLLGTFRRLDRRPVGNIARLELCPCLPDWNHDQIVDTADFFAFLSDFFIGNADINDDGYSDSQDLFDFLTSFYAGC